MRSVNTEGHWDRDSYPYRTSVSEDSFQTFYEGLYVQAYQYSMTLVEQITCKRKKVISPMSWLPNTTGFKHSFNLTLDSVLKTTCIFQQHNQSKFEDHVMIRKWGLSEQVMCLIQIVFNGILVNTCSKYAESPSINQSINKPTTKPTIQPTNQPTNQPAAKPTMQPTNQATLLFWLFCIDLELHINNTKRTLDDGGSKSAAIMVGESVRQSS